MLRGLTQAGLGEIGSIERYIALAAQYEFQAVDLDAKAFIDSTGGEAAAKTLLQEHGIMIGSIGLPVQWRTTEEQFQQDLVQLAEHAAAAAALGCRSCCTYILPSTDENAAHFMAVATRRLRICAEVLDAYGIRLGLEFVGPHHLRTRWKNPFIWTLQETLDWIEAINSRNVGLLFDAYHWYTTGLTTADIMKLRPEQIVHVHINDAPPVPVEEALDNGRLYPGEGVIDLTGFLKALKQIGYQGVVAQEILMQAPPADPLEAVLQRSKAGFDKVFHAADLT
ncbi:MAG: xylose isomerase [Paenibacillus sp. RIFOXYA1_FULL_44_5]|nr:MAG: xylose isomerase [Paenibacillus sp. RIFOXYA1_FULL_44_5]